MPMCHYTWREKLAPKLLPKQKKKLLVSYSGVQFYAKGPHGHVYWAMPHYTYLCKNKKRK